MIARLHELAPYEPRLAVGPAATSLEDAQQLVASRITGLLSLQTDDDLAAHGMRWTTLWQLFAQQGIHALRVPIRDFDKRDLARRLDDGLAALDTLFSDGRKVYLHCTAGLNRSPTLALAHLFRTHGLDAERILFERHPDALPDLELASRWWQRHALR